MLNKLMFLYYNTLFFIGNQFFKYSYPLNKLGSYFINKVLSKNVNIDFGLHIVQLKKLDSLNCIDLTLSNYLLLNVNQLLPAIFCIVTSHPQIQQLGQFKIIFCIAISNQNQFSLHNNFLINPTTTILDYYDHYKSHLRYLNKSNYDTFNINFINIKIWNMDDLKNKHIELPSQDNNI